MRTTTLQSAIGSALLLLASHPCQATPQHLQHRHQHQHQQHRRLYEHPRGDKRDNYTPGNATVNPRYEARRSDKLQARDGAKCEFPTDKGLVAVTPDATNGGWAMSPDKECVDGTWCPIACPSGQLMAQWKPDTTYVFPESTYGGIYCDGGEIDVPFADEPWCVDGTGTVAAVNNAGDVVSFCQTVLPGYEDMLIPTDVQGTVTLAVPNPSYWDSTAAHYYVNAPGVSAAVGCVWGDDSQPIGNWAPYVAGANMDGNGNTFVKLGINPVWQDSALYGTKPTFGMKIECDGDCNGLPCEINGNGVVSDEMATGAGGADFCVVTATGNGKANIIIFNLDGSDGSGGDDGGDASTSSSAPSSTSEPASTSTSSTPTPTPTTMSTPTSTSIAPSTSAPSSTSTSSSSITSSAALTTTSSASLSSTSSYPVSASSSSEIPFLGGVFHQNGTSSDVDELWSNPTATSELSPESTGESKGGSKNGNGSESGTESGSQGGSQSGTEDQGQSQGQSESSTKPNHTENAGRRKDETAIAGFIVAFVAAVYLL